MDENGKKHHLNAGIKSIKYYTRAHPIYRDGLEILFHYNGIPYVKWDNETHTFSMEKFHRWLAIGFISYCKHQSVTIEDIKKTVCEHENININIVYNKTRKSEIIKARQIIQYLARDFQLGTFAEIGYATGKKDHATVLYSSKTISDYIDTYPTWRQKIFDIKNKIIS